MTRVFRDRCQREGALRVTFEAIPDLAITAWRQHMDTLRQDVLYTFRTLRKNPGFALVAFLTLALVIGANTTVFSVVNGVLLQPLPYGDPGRLVQLYEKRPRQGRVRNPVSAPDFVDWQKQNAVFEGMAALTGNAFTLGGDSGPELIRGGSVSPNFFQMLHVEPVLGRDFLAEEETPGKDRVVLLNHGLWLRRFGGDPKIVGQSILLSGTSNTVVGVLPDIPNVIQSEAQIWKPLVLSAGFRDGALPRGAHFLAVFARLKPGVSLQRARSEMDTVAGRLEREFPNENTGHGINVFTLQEEITGNVRPALFILLGAVGLVLLIACANIANLALVRTSRRRREISIRAALGAGSGRVVRQLLTESVLLSLMGGLAGFFLAGWAVRALAIANPGNIPRLKNIQIDEHVLLFTLAVSLVTGIIFGLAPVLYARRTKLTDALRDGGRGSTDSLARNKPRAALLIAEVALAVVLSIGAGLMLQSFVKLSNVNPGFDAENVLAIDIALMDKKYSKDQDRVSFFENFLGRMRSLPGVISAGATVALPLTGRDSGSNFLIEGQPVLPYSQQHNARFRVVSPGYFETMKIPLRSGRTLGNQDAAKAPLVLVMNETMARQFWPDENVLGKRITISGENALREIVGVVADVRHYSLNGESRPEMYFSLQQQPVAVMTVVVRTASAPESLEGAVRRQLSEIDKEQPIARMQTVEQVLATSVAQPRFYSTLMGAFSTVALILAALGIYGVMSFAVGQRTHEMGVRMALGARASNVQALVLREGMLLASAGVVLGIAGAFALTRAMGGLLYGVAATDPATFLGAALLLSSVAAGACYIPARRATRVDPMIALRSE
jgi:putative ABC transport system permease protein